MVSPVEQAREAIRSIEGLRRAEGEGKKYWFALCFEQGYLGESEPAIRVVTSSESMPLTRAMSAALSPVERGGLWLFGRYLVVDVLDDTPPEVYFESEEAEAVRAVEVLVVLHPGKGIRTPTLAGSLALGLPGNALHDFLVLAADCRPQGWPP